MAGLLQGLFNGKLIDRCGLIVAITYWHLDKASVNLELEFKLDSLCML